MAKKQTDRKPSRARTFAYRIIIISLLGIVCVSGYKVATSFMEYREAQNKYIEIGEIALVNPNQFTGEIDWEALLEINSDVQGWIYLKDSNINYPVVKGVNNEEYLHHLITGEYNYSGTIFVDYRCKDNFEGMNTIIHGHHMQDRSMFANLANFVNKEGYYDTHKQFELITPQEKYHILVLSAFVTDATSDTYQTDFASADEMMAFANTVKSQSSIYTDDVPVEANDRLITLSTCVNAEGPARYVVIGKLVKWTDEEKKEALETQATIDGNKS